MGERKIFTVVFLLFSFHLHPCLATEQDFSGITSAFYLHRMFFYILGIDFKLSFAFTNLSHLFVSKPPCIIISFLGLFFYFDEKVSNLFLLLFL